MIYDNVMYPLKYEDLIVENAKSQNLNAPLVASVINVESSFREDVVSSKGAVGLMQVMPETAKWLLNTKMNIEYDENADIEGLLKKPNFNIKIGCFYLNYLKNKFADLNTALFAYNAGEGNVAQWLKDKKYSCDGKKLSTSPFPEANNYVKKVNNNLKVYENKF
ncbi:MAG: lytic transglycosylase domain-containing protein [Clostridia bacterium]|nr:lytic transglycosylase domain-containing protein [Clostridia bacterium]